MLDPHLQKLCPDVSSSFSATGVFFKPRLYHDPGTLHDYIKYNLVTRGRAGVHRHAAALSTHKTRPRRPKRKASAWGGALLAIRDFLGGRRMGPSIYFLRLPLFKLRAELQLLM